MRKAVAVGVLITVNAVLAAALSPAAASADSAWQRCVTVGTRNAGGGCIETCQTWPLWVCGAGACYDQCPYNDDDDDGGGETNPTPEG